MNVRLISIVIAIIISVVWWYWPQLSFYAGNYRYNNYQYTDAIKHYTNAIHSNRLNSTMLGKSHFGRAQSVLNLAFATRSGDAEIYSALQDYNKAIELISDNPYYYRERGTAYSYLGAYEEAFNDFDTISEYEGSLPLWSLVRKGGLEKRLGNYNQAILTLNAAIDAWQPEPVMPPNYHLALTYLELGQFGKAIEAINEGEKAQTDYGSAYQIRGCAYANLGQYEAAFADYKKGVDLNQSYRIQSDIIYPVQEHNSRVEQEELNYIQSLSDKLVQPSSDKLEKLCFQSWWQLHYDNKRERSSYLSARN